MKPQTLGELFGEWWDSCNTTDTDRLQCVLKSYETQRDLLEDNADRIKELKERVAEQDRISKLEARVAELERINSDHCTELAIRKVMCADRDRYREALEGIRDTWSQMSDNMHSNTAYAIATHALDPRGCAEMAKLANHDDDYDRDSNACFCPER